VPRHRARQLAQLEVGAAARLLEDGAHGPSL
jgi:hypothetical protein